MAKTKIVSGISNLVFKVKEWVKNNPKEAAFLFLILLLASVLRLYRISEYMTFLGDEGRDVILVRRLLVNADPILIGPGTSIGNMYLGPLYYYMMAPALFLAGYSPAGPAVQIALLGVGTVFFIWYIARQWFGKIAALIAGFLYCLSPVVITYSRSSWNPNMMPFFALLSIYGIWQVWQKNKFGWLVVAAISFAFVLQSHYLGLLLAPVAGFFWLLTLLKVRKSKPEARSLLKHSLIGAVVFIFLMSPLVIFDARHGWQNSAAMRKFFAERQTTVSAKPWSAIPNLWPLTQKVSTRLLAATDKDVGRAMAIGVGVLAGWIVVTIGKIKTVGKKGFLLIFIWLLVAFIGLGVYKQEIYDHYFGFFFAAPFLFIGGASQLLIERCKNLGIFLVIVAIFAMAYVAIRQTPIKYPPNRQLQRTIEVAEKIKIEAGENKYNLAVIAERNYEDAYQYFLEAWDTKVSDIDSQRLEETVGEYLFVVCELPKEKCDPTHSPKAEVANFGWSKIEAEWQVGGVILYKLAHST
jgi:4-amino-4-deoxy-L-arabinose transferase-like glycosyltransferase